MIGGPTSLYDEGWLKYAAEEAKKEKDLKEVAEVIAREKGTAAEAVEEKARELKSAQVVAEEECHQA